MVDEAYEMLSRALGSIYSHCMITKGYGVLDTKSCLSYIVNLEELMGELQSLYEKREEKPLRRLRSNLELIIKAVGYPSIRSYYRDRLKITYIEDNDELVLLDKIIIPISISTVEAPLDRDLILSPLENDPFHLLSLFRIRIRCGSARTVEVTGITHPDTANIFLRSAPVIDPYLFSKINRYRSIVGGMSDDEFWRRRPITPDDIVVAMMDDHLVKEIVEEENRLYMTVKRSTFQQTMKSFVDPGTTSRQKYEMIRIFLIMGDPDRLKIGGLLISLVYKNDRGLYEEIYERLGNLPGFVPPSDTQEIVDSKPETEVEELRRKLGSHPYMPETVRTIALKKVAEMTMTTNDYHKQLVFANTLYDFPWPSFSEEEIRPSQSVLNSVREMMDRMAYGHIEAKRYLLCTVAKWMRNPSVRGSCIGLVGPPGVGKTVLARSIGEALGIPFVQINLGGQNEAEFLHGHSYTYSGSSPGMIIRKMVDAGKSRCVMYFDELDKCGSKNSSLLNDIMSVLIHLTDSSTNERFQDRFFQGVDFPMNRVIFVFSYNDSSRIDPVLMDRLTEIKVGSYTRKEKLAIADRFILPEVYKEMRIDPTTVSFGEGTVGYIIDHYTREAGVRRIKEMLERIIMHVNAGNILGNPIRRIDAPTVDEILRSENKIPKPFLLRHPRVGMTHAVFTTLTGCGGVTVVQVIPLRMPASSMATITGLQGSVMRESVSCALAAVQQRMTKTQLERFPHGFHVHASDAGTPKDGPSAGAAFAVCFMSLYMDVKLSNRVAITGEIDLDCRVLPVGGLGHKIEAAKEANLETLFVSRMHSVSLDTCKNEHPELFEDGGFQVVLIDSVDDVISAA